MVYRAGFLPGAGGYLDQPNEIMERMRIIEAALHENAEKK